MSFVVIVVPLSAALFVFNMLAAISKIVREKDPQIGMNALLATIGLIGVGIR